MQDQRGGATPLRIHGLTEFGAHPELVRRWSLTAETLTDVQERAVRAGLFDQRTNLLVVAPTSSGKTFVGELAAAGAVLTGTRSRALFLVPYRALAEEHFQVFRERYDDLFVVEITTGDHPERDGDVLRGRFNLAVMTYEKLRGFLIQDHSFLDRIATVVVDEVQMLADSARGAGLELLITRILRMGRAPQLVALSASIEDDQALSKWLRAVPIISSLRPVPLREGVCGPSGEAVFVRESVSTREVVATGQPDREHLLAELVTRAVADGEQVLVFFPTVKQSISQARRIAGLLPARGVDPAIGAELAGLEQTESTRALAYTLASGVAYHNSELSFDERALVEGAFRKGAVRALLSTTTLAMGVNLPCDKVIISSAERPERVRNAWIFRAISPSEYRNAAGRAGRLGQRSAGTALLLAGDNVERDALVREYVLAPADPLESRLPGRPLGDLVFDVLAGQVAGSKAELLDFIRSTYAYTTFYAGPDGGGDGGVRTAIDAAVATCLRSGLVEERNDELHPTQVASALAGAGVGLATGARLAHLARSARTSQLTPYELLFEICLCREMPAYPFPPDHDPRRWISTSHWTYREGSSLATALAATTLSEPTPHALVRLAFLDAWIHGASESKLRAFAGANGRRAMDAARTAAWLLDSFVQAAQVSGVVTELLRELAGLGLGLRYGVPPALVPVARLEARGVGRADLMRILEAGDARLLNPENLVDAEESSFAGLLTVRQVQQLREAVALTVRDALRRRKAEHFIRAAAAQMPDRLIRELYEAQGPGLEQAVSDALSFIGLPVRRVFRQPHGEPDIVLEYSGTVVISVTASADDALPVKWAKAREVMSAGAGLNPVNCVCVARPGFHGGALEAARNLAREAGERRLLLVPIPTVAELVLRFSAGSTSSDAIGRMLTDERGALDEARLAALALEG